MYGGFRHAEMLGGVSYGGAVVDDVLRLFHGAHFDSIHDEISPFSMLFTAYESKDGGRTPHWNSKV
jgi:hypothetical protein